MKCTEVFDRAVVLVPQLIRCLVPVTFVAVGCDDSSGGQQTVRHDVNDAETETLLPLGDATILPDATGPVAGDSGTSTDSSSTVEGDASVLACRENYQQWVGEVDAVMVAWGAPSTIMSPDSNGIWQLRGVASSGGFVAMQGKVAEWLFSPFAAPGENYAFHGLLVQPPAEPDGGGVYCIGAGTVLVDAVKSFSIAVERISRLGSCPGTPIAGELTLCTAPFGACPREIWGSLDGVPVLVDGFSLYTADAFTDEYLIGDSTLAIRFKHVDREPTFAGGLVWTTPDSPFGGAVYCASEGIFMEEPAMTTLNNGTVVDDAKFTYALRGLSKVGVCEPDSGSPSSLRGCMRARD